MRRYLLIAAALAWTCAGSRVRKEEDALEADFAATDRGISIAELEAVQLRELIRGVTERYDDATRTFDEAGRRFEEARRAGDAASAEYRSAEASYASATSRWHEVTLTMLVVAASDVTGTDGCGRQSTASYRRELKAEGVDLEGKDIDHVIPRSLGGADNRWNYQVLDSSVNRSLGNRGAVGKCLSLGPQCLLALATTARQLLTCSP